MKRHFKLLVLFLIMQFCVGCSPTCAECNGKDANFLYDKRNYLCIGCIEKKYNDAMAIERKGDYEEAKAFYEKMATNYEPAKDRINEIDELGIKYLAALEEIEKGDYEEAKIILKKLPSAYKETGVLYENIDKVEKLLGCSWETEGNYDGSTFKIDFSIYVSTDDTIQLIISQEEYLEGDYIYTYKDTISGVSMYDLLSGGKANVDANEQDPYKIDISDIMKSKFYITYTYSGVTFKFVMSK